MDIWSRTTISDRDLVDLAHQLVAQGNFVLARLIVVLINVEERGLYVGESYASMNEFCVARLGLSKGAAYRRTNAAKLVRKFPALLPLIESGRVTLSALVVLRDELTAENFDELIAATRGMSRREIEAHLRSRNGTVEEPAPPASLRKLPTLQTNTTIHAVTDAGGRPPVFETRYRLVMTMDEALVAKTERARDLLANVNPTRDFNRMFEAALDALIEKCESEAAPSNVPSPHQASADSTSEAAAADVEPPAPETSSPQAPAPAPPSVAKTSGNVPREVLRRDGGRCTHVDGSGERCAETRLLELDEIVPRALGGDDRVENLRLRCRVHERAETVPCALDGGSPVAPRCQARRRASAARTSRAAGA